MYLKLTKGKLENEMREMNRLVLEIFRYLSTAGRLNRKAFEAALPAGDKWLMGYYRGLLPKLQSLMKEPRDQRQTIYDALKHDMEFDLHIGDSGFRFWEKELSREQTEKVKALVLHLYEQLFYKGKTRASGQQFSYQEFKEGLSPGKRINVCPACLGYRDDLKANGGEADHYLPKAKYPGLIFHPANLAVICDECNGLGVKGEKDALEQANLTEVYFPYLRAAEEEAKLSVLGDGGKRYLGLTPAAAKAGAGRQAADPAAKRIENLEELFCLRERWKSRLDNCIEGQAAWLKELDDPAEIERVLKEEARRMGLKAVEQKYLLPEEACLEYLCGSGLEAILEECRRRREEKRKLEENEIST